MSNPIKNSKFMSLTNDEKIHFLASGQVGSAKRIFISVNGIATPRWLAAILSVVINNKEYLTSRDAKRAATKYLAQFKAKSKQLRK